MRICLSCDHRHDQQDWLCPVCHNKPTRRMSFLSFAPEVLSEQIGFKAEYYNLLAEREQGSFWFRSRNRLLVWALKTWFPSAQNFLEIGCGTGFVLQELRTAFPEMRLAGSEVLFEGMLYASQRVPNVTLFQMDARRIPFENEFDVVGAFDVLEHIEEDELVLRQMYQAAKPGGGILVTVPQHPRLWSEYDRIDGHCRRYTRRELRAKVEAAGFHIIRITSFVSLLLPALFGVRRANRNQVPTDRQKYLSELQISRLLDRCLENVMRLERWFIRGGVSLPVGGSLLLAARKEREQTGSPSGSETTR